MSSSIVEGITRFMNREQELNDTLYAEAGKEYTATIMGDERNTERGRKGSHANVVQALHCNPECDNCRTTVDLKDAKVIVNGPDEQLVSHVSEIRNREWLKA